MFELKLSMKKIYSIAMAGLSLLLFIFSFIPHVKVSMYGYSSTANLWDGNKAQPVIMLFSYIGIITVYLLSLFGVLKDKWVNYANYAVGAVAFWNVAYLFDMMKYTSAGIWLGAIFSLGMLTVAILWHLLGRGGNQAPKQKISGYDPKTGKPIYE